MKKNEYGLNWIFKKTKGTRLQLVLYTFCILVSTVITISLAYILKLFVDIATGDLDESLLMIGVISIAVISFGGIITVVNSVLSQYIFGKTERSLRMELMNVIFSRRMIDISKQHTGELMTKLTLKR